MFYSMNASEIDKKKVSKSLSIKDYKVKFYSQILTNIVS